MESSPQMLNSGEQGVTIERFGLTSTGPNAGEPRGQLEGTLRALNDDEQCANVLQRLAAARGAINSLMAELMEDHIRNHMPRNSKSSDEATEDLIGIVRTYLK